MLTEGFKAKASSCKIHIDDLGNDNLNVLSLCRELLCIPLKCSENKTLREGESGSSIADAETDVSLLDYEANGLQAEQF